MAKTEKFGKMCKDKMTNEILSRLENKPNFFITSYMGSTVSDLEQIRKSLRASSSSYFVVKNSTLRVVLDKIKLSEVKDLVDGGVGISLSGDDVVGTSKVLVDFSKTHSKFTIKGAVLDGKPVAAEKIKALAALPPRQVLLAQVVGGIKAPITGFVNVLGGVLRNFVYAVDAIRSKKEKEAPPQAPAAAAAPSQPAQTPAESAPKQDAATPAPKQEVPKEEPPKA